MQSSKMQTLNGGTQRKGEKRKFDKEKEVEGGPMKVVASRLVHMARQLTAV